MQLTGASQTLIPINSKARFTGSMAHLAFRISINKKISLIALAPPIISQPLSISSIALNAIINLIPFALLARIMAIIACTSIFISFGIALLNLD